jgi:dTDP-4-dehydrorhamnose reductase
MRIAILGANGQLGNDLTSELTAPETFPLTRSDFDVTNPSRTRAVLTDLRPRVIINTTAYHRVDDCEDHAELAYTVNVLAVLNLVRIANDLNALLVHFSTDYVFDGKSREPYIESSEPFPLSVYGNSKLAGELIVRTTAKEHLLIRTCGLYGRAGSRGKGGNFVETMLKKARSGDRIKVVDDQVVTPTSTADLARQVAVLLRSDRQGHQGLFHMTNEGACSWHEFARGIFEISGVQADLVPTTSDLYKTPAIRPRYSVLENKRLKDIGMNRMSSWRDALAEYLGRPVGRSG